MIHYELESTPIIWFIPELAVLPRMFRICRAIRRSGAARFYSCPVWRRRGSHGRVLTDFSPFWIGGRTRSGAHGEACGRTHPGIVCHADGRAEDGGGAALGAWC